MLVVYVFAVATACSPNEAPEKVTSGELEQWEWPLREEYVVDDWAARKSDIEALRDMTEDAGIHVITLFGEHLDIRSESYEEMAIEDLANLDEMLALMNRSEVRSILRYIGIVTIFVRPPKTAADTTVFANYVYNHPIPAKQCAENPRDISCGICEVVLDDNWYLRLTWSSGPFEVERSENHSKFYQDSSHSLSIEEIDAQYDESKNACMQSGLEEMGYENPRDLYTNDR